ncbi:hypothetical protein RHGRI_012693 [Rhododendron griersonianum]|uniref:Exostosin GT47 domain-containing protein n=1 Tax=Rhododendron griersonianum TaxID=479676 RepID=A0AAV6KRV0_9ERIC|nr:hypothetical protein RHGRI_012693 [Rhododendron griersonianum]
MNPHKSSVPLKLSFCFLFLMYSYLQHEVVVVTSLLIYLPSVRGVRGRGEMAHGSPAISQAAQPMPFGAICCYPLVDGGLSASGFSPCALPIYMHERERERDVLNSIHSIDYWLWTDLIAPESERLLKNVVRVHRQEEADLFYIPNFTTISFFLMEKQQCKALYREALKWVTDQPAWKRSEGRDHILPVHHPWSFKSVRRYMKNAIWLLPDMDSTGNWYKPGQFSFEKDLILPYVPNVHLCDPKCLSESETNRKTLLFFRGRLKRNAGGKIRSKLGAELSGAEGVQIEEGTAGEAGKEAAEDGMRKSIFCLSPACDTLSSARLFDAIVSGCIPVIVSDELELPFEGILDYRKIALFVSSSDAVQPGWLLTFLRSISPSQIREMRTNLAKYSRHFLYSHPAQPLGPEDLVWRMMAGKLVNIKLHTRRSQRVVKECRSLCTCDCSRANLTSPGGERI